MAVTAKELIRQLPPYEDLWITIKENQNVKDIIKEVLTAHDEFAPYYDKIALYFDGNNAEDITDNLYQFISKNIQYKEESEDDQTSALPTGILIRGHGDCKHYSLFTGGILDALNRAGKKIDWCYCFASYKWLDKTPHHVFIKVNDGNKELWFDPTPSANKMEPVWMTNKKIKASPMALRRNIAGVGTNNYTRIEDIAWENVISGSTDNDNGELERRPFWQLMAAEGVRGKDGNHGTNPYFSGPFLGLQHYLEDPYSIEGTNWQTTANDINAKVQTGPHPGHSWPADFVKWVYETNLKGWNFYYPGGVQPGYEPNLPGWYPHLLITDDGRLTFDRDQKIDDYMNDEVHALTAWAQAIINKEDPTPYPVKPQHLKEFSQLKQGNVDKRNLFTEARGDSFFKALGKGIVNALKFVKDGVFKIVGSAPRNAFLAAVGLNLFHLGTKLQQSINDGKWEAMSKKWKSLGGNPDKLRNTIEDGARKDPPPEDQQHVIGEPMSASAILAIAAPILAAMMKFIKDPEGKLKGILSATKSVLATQFPNVDFTPFAFLDGDTGLDLQFEVDPKDDENLGGGHDGLSDDTDIISQIKDMAQKNPLPAAAVVGIGAYFLTKKGNKANWLIVGIAAAGTYFLLQQGSKPGGLTVAAKKAALLQWVAGNTDNQAGKNKMVQVINQMTDAEIGYTWDFIFNYFLKEKQVIKDSPLYKAIKAISDKYEIFT